MTRPTKATSEFRRLLADHCNGTLEESQFERFDALLHKDEAARETYLACMAVEAELHACHASSASPAEQPAASAQPRSLEPAINRSRWASRFAIAAALIGVAVLSSGLTLTVEKLSDRNADAVATANAEASQLAVTPVARISATRNCRWKKPEGQVGFGAELMPQQRLELAAGVAEIAFDSGATVILEGPATLDINDGKDALLLSGRLAARVPSATGWFTVRAGRIGVGEEQPRASHAEFGLLADGRGGGEVHVFGGSVRAHLLDNAGDQIRSVQLLPSEAARVRPASTTVSRFRADGDRFVRSLFSSGGPHGGLYAYEGFDYPSGPLAWQNGGFGWAGPWADIEAGDDLDPNSMGGSTNLVTEESLAYGPMAATGNRAIQTSQRNRIRRALSTSVGGVFDAAGLVENRDGHRMLGSDGKTIYVSFLQRIDKLDDVFYGFEMHRGDGNGNRVLCFGNGADGAGYGVTSNYNAYGARNFPSLGEENADVNLIIAKIEYGTGDRDVVTVYRNPASLLDESRCEPIAKLRGNFAFDRISFGNFDGSKQHEVDEVRIGTNFRAVTGKRDPAGNLERSVAELQDGWFATKPVGVAGSSGTYLRPLSF
ncbi:MAG: hypothetical protein AAGF31_01170 [Planctomycetota bacterium]